MQAILSATVPFSSSICSTPWVLGVCLTAALLIVFFTVAVSLNSRPGRAPSCGLAGAAR